MPAFGNNATETVYIHGGALLVSESPGYEFYCRELLKWHWNVNMCAIDCGKVSGNGASENS